MSDARRIAKPAKPTSGEAVRHTGDSRVNIPTAELGSLAEAEGTGPQPLRYPRDPSLDPQLVWKGKDEQDGEDLVVPAIPIDIHEQVSPKAIIEDLREASAGRRDEQLDLFHSDFNGPVAIATEDRHFDAIAKRFPLDIVRPPQPSAPASA